MYELGKRVPTVTVVIYIYIYIMLDSHRVNYYKICLFLEVVDTVQNCCYSYLGKLPPIA